MISLFIVQIWEVDPFDADVRCCVAKHRFRDLYPSTEITGNVDAGYLRWGEKSVYFYKGDYVYRADLYNTVVSDGFARRVWKNGTQPVSLENVGTWNSRWKDVCDVATYAYSQCIDL